jgi:arylsulfatase A-like enzyme
MQPIACLGFLIGLTARLIGAFHNQLRTQSPHVQGSRLPVSIAVSSACCGLYLTTLSGCSIVKSAYNGPDIAGEKRELAALMREQFRMHIVRTIMVVLSASFCIGAILGTACALLLYSRDRISGIPTRSARESLRRTLFLAIVVHTGLFLRDAAARPLLYRDIFEAARARRLHRVLTDWLKTESIAAMFLTGIAVWFAIPFAKRRRHGCTGIGSTIVSRKTILGIIGLALLVKILGSIALFPSRRNRLKLPNILIVAADSLRADRITTRTAPCLTAFAERAVTFENAYVSLARTLPSWVTLLTGRFPHRHGVRHMFSRWDARFADLKPITEQFAMAGYRTAVTSDFGGDIFPRARLGFQIVEAPTFNLRELLNHHFVSSLAPLHPFLQGRLIQRIFPGLWGMCYTADARYVTKNALRTIDRISDNPFFMTVFYSNTHFPYVAPAPYFRRFTQSGYRGDHKYGKEYELFGETELVSPDDVRQTRALYDGAVAFIDEAIDRLLAGLRDRGLDQNTIVLVTSDHGESLYDHGRGQGHGDHLFGDEGTHVPLMIFDPKYPRPRRVSGMVRDVDVAPTICELAGIAVPPGMDGCSLVAAMRGIPQDPEFAFAESEIWFNDPIPAISSEMRRSYPSLAQLIEVDYEHDDEVVLRSDFENVVNDAKHRMIRDMRYKLIYAPTRTGVRWFLFDTLKDPGEVHDVSSDFPEIAESLRIQLRKWMLSGAPARAVTGQLYHPSSPAK